MRIILFSLIIFVFLPFAFADTQGWNVVKSTHFVVYYQNAPEDFINRVTQEAEDYYNRIAEALGFIRFNFWLWDNRANITIYDNKSEYQKATQQPAWSYGSALIGRKEKTILGFVFEEGFFESVLPHEMGHIIFKEFVGFVNPAVPHWLHEGVASYQERSRVASASRVLRGAINENKFMNLEKLFDFDPFAEVDAQTVGIFYAEAVSLVDFLIKEFGRDRFVLFCQYLRDRKDFRRALASAYSFSNIQELDGAWQKYLSGIK
ncbi:MAG: peptidase MA family metallohydrolase [Candidatus Omnitrophota bacterium]